MEEVVKLIVGILFLLLAFPIGNWLAKVTKDEKKQGQKWFRILIYFGLLGAVAGLVLKNDVSLFSFSFMALISLKSLK